MTTPPKLTDRHALALHRKRAEASDTTAWFLHDHAIDIVSERLKEVNRSFTRPAFIGPRASVWAETLKMDAVCVEDTANIALSENSHDLILHIMSMHWADDPVGQLVQMRRALQPDGLMIAVFFAGQTLHQLRSAMATAESTVRGGISPRVAPMGELRDLGALLQRSGFALPVADIIDFDVAYQNPVKLMHDLRGMGENNALEARDRRPMTKSFLSSISDVYAQHFSRSDGRILARFDLCFLTGWAPDKDQQQPLRPGSAQARLADALGTAENPLKS